MGHMTARWYKTLGKLILVTGLVLPSIIWLTQTLPNELPKQELAKVVARRPLTHHAVIQGLGFNSTLLQTSVTTHEVDADDSNSSFPIEEKNPPKIFFNRVPKCGSTAIKAIFRKLAKMNGWLMASSTDFSHEAISEAAQLKFVQEFNSLRPPVIYERHINFVNFTKFGSPLPFYINVVREPLERLVSDYYFLRTHLQYMFPMEEEKRKRTYDECVHGNYSECTSDGFHGYYRIIPFFCGQHSYCRSPSSASLHTAMRNVETYYSLIGIAEELPGFMQVLEHIAPRYFKHAHSVFIDNEKQMKEKFHTRGKLPPKNSTIAIMKAKLSYDYEFYGFIRRKFYATWKKVKLKYGIET